MIGRPSEILSDHLGPLGVKASSANRDAIHFMPPRFSSRTRAWVGVQTPWTARPALIWTNDQV